MYSIVNDQNFDEYGGLRALYGLEGSEGRRILKHEVAELLGCTLFVSFYHSLGIFLESLSQRKIVLPSNNVGDHFGFQLLMLNHLRR